MAGAAAQLPCNSGAAVYDENAKLFTCSPTCTPVGLVGRRTPGP